MDNPISVKEMVTVKRDNWLQDIIDRHFIELDKKKTDKKKGNHVSSKINV